MFGRGKTGMSANAKFVMAKGRQVGNLSAPKKKPPLKLPQPAVMEDRGGRKSLGAQGAITVPAETVPLKVGRVKRMK